MIPTILESRKWSAAPAVGLSGPVAAGKTTAGRFLEAHGFRYGRYSQALSRTFREAREDLSREDLQRRGWELKRGGKQRWLGRMVVSALPKDGRIVIDGLRFPEDHALLVETFGPRFRHVWLEAPKEIRLHRYVRQGYSSCDFRAAVEHPVEMGVTDLGRLAHVVVRNAGSLEELRQGLLVEIVQSAPVSEDGD